MSDKYGDFTPVIKVELKRADVADIVRRDKLLLTSPFVKALGALQEIVFARAIARRYPDKVVIFQRGDTGDALFLVLQGEVRLFARKETDNVELGVVHRGDVLGEGEVLDATSIRAASAVAQGATEIAEIPRGALLQSGVMMDAVKAYLEHVRSSRAKALDEMNDFMKRW